MKAPDTHDELQKKSQLVQLIKSGWRGFGVIVRGRESGRQYNLKWSRNLHSHNRCLVNKYGVRQLLPAVDGCPSLWFVAYSCCLMSTAVVCCLQLRFDAHSGGFQSDEIKKFLHILTDVCRCIDGS